MSVVVAFNAFKGSLSPVDAGMYFIKGLKKRKPELDVIHFPIADGGDGTLEVWKYHFGGHIEYLQAHDPLMREIKVPVLIEKEGAMFAMADVSGVAMLRQKERDAKRTTTYGMGEVIRQLVDRGIKNIVISVGGSATVDGGIGLLLALGFKIYTDNGNVQPSGELLLHVQDIEKETDWDLNIVVLSDVDNCLTGENGAAYVYGPQKGLKPGDIPLFDDALYRWASLVEKKHGVKILDMPRYGAAGGVAVALHLLGNLKIVSGIDYLLEKAGFIGKVKNARILFTGEGKIDRQTFMGKAPYGAARLFRKFGKRMVIGIGGFVVYEEVRWEVFDSVFSLANGPISYQQSVKNARHLMEYMGFNIAGIIE